MNTRRATGIPMEELMETTKDNPLAMIHSSGKFVVPIMHHNARMNRKPETLLASSLINKEETFLTTEAPKTDMPQQTTPTTQSSSNFHSPPTQMPIITSNSDFGGGTGVSDKINFQQQQTHYEEQTNVNEIL